MRRVSLPLVVVAAGLLLPAGAQAKIPLDKMEHSVRVVTVERTGQPASVKREEVWVAEDRSRMVVRDLAGAVLGETVYGPEGTVNHQPGSVPVRWPTVRGTGTPTLAALAETSCGIRGPETKRLRAVRRHGRTVDVWRLAARGPKMSSTTTCWVERRSHRLLESRLVTRALGQTLVQTVRVERVELLPRDPQLLSLSPEAAALVGQGVPLPAPAPLP